jgi:hypothetical protein
VRVMGIVSSHPVSFPYFLINYDVSRIAELIQVAHQKIPCLRVNGFY